MDFFEIEGKACLQARGIPTGGNYLYTEDSDPASFTYPCVVKSQALSGKRGKAGGIRFAKNPAELTEATAAISQLIIGGKKVEGIMICDMLDIDEEFYLGLTLDTKYKRMLMLFTPYGGMDIEDLAANSPEKLVRLDCTTGFHQDDFLNKISPFQLEKSIVEQLCDIAEKLTNACFALDATTLEINPLAKLKDGTLIAADCKLVIDDNALSRQDDHTILPRTDSVETTPIEALAESMGLAYVELDKTGTIGVMAGGAGIGMATVDTITAYGGKAHNFLDLGGGVTAEKTYNAMKLLLESPGTTGILVNVFGGINNCADMAKGIEKAILEVPTAKTIVVKSRGFNQEEGWEIYQRLGILQTKYGTTDEAVLQLLEKMEGC